MPQTTPLLPVEFVSLRPNKISLYLARPYKADLYLGAIFITRVAAGPPVAGYINPVGTSATQGGKAYLQLNPEEFASVFAWASRSSSGLNVDITYEGTQVTDIGCLSLLPMANAAQLEGVAQRLGEYSADPAAADAPAPAAPRAPAPKERHPPVG